MTNSIKLVVIDYQSGNLRSVAKALESVRVSPVVTGKAAEIGAADAVVLPGVGSGPAAMEALRRRDLVEPIREYVASGRPFLGVCLGLQLLLERTEEGDADCLGSIAGRVKRLPEGQKVPHMGWNELVIRQRHPILKGIKNGKDFYFVHSYHLQCEDEREILASTEYGGSICAVVGRENMIGTQFHPEKSGEVGLKILRRFILQ